MKTAFQTYYTERIAKIGAASVIDHIALACAVGGHRSDVAPLSHTAVTPTSIIDATIAGA